MPTDLVTVPDVHLCSVGRWEVAVGPEVDSATGHPVWTVTPEQLASIVAAQDDPGIRTPIVKLGHQDKLTEISMPAVGHIENLRTTDDGMELYGDLTGVPRWLAEILPSAYASRSVEVSFDYAASGTHRTHEAVLTALALLGEEEPAIGSLEDIQALYSGELDALVAAAKRGGAVRRVLLSKEAPVKDRRAVASVSIDTMRNKFYDKLPVGSWAWIREVWNDFIIVDNDEAVLYRIPWSETSDGDVEFGDPEPVVVEYVEAPDAALDDAPILLARCAAVGPRLSVRASRTPEEGTMPNKDLAVRLGLPEDATQDDIDAAVLAKLDEPTPDPVTDPKVDPPVAGDGQVVVDEEAFAELKREAAAGAQAAKTIAERDRDEYLDRAVKAGKFPPARREHYRKMYDADLDGAKSIIDGLEAGLVPVDGAALGHSTNVEAMSDDAIWTALFGAEKGA